MPSINSLLLIAPPGGGKGTVTKLLLNRCKALFSQYPQQHFSMGDVLRKNLDQLPQDQQAKMRNGELLPAQDLKEILFREVRNCLGGSSSAGGGHAVVDGVNLQGGRNCSAVRVEHQDASLDDNYNGTSSRPPWIILDGFPRTVEQAKLLEQEDERSDEHQISDSTPTSSRVDAEDPADRTTITPKIAVFLDVPTEEILDRIEHRLIHPGSGRTYNEKWNPPKVPNVDDVTGEPLERRADDDFATVKRRLEVFREFTWKPLLDHYVGQRPPRRGTSTQDELHEDGCTSKTTTFIVSGDGKGAGLVQQLTSAAAGDPNRSASGRTRTGPRDVFDVAKNLNLINQGRRSEAIVEELLACPEFRSLLGLDALEREHSAGADYTAEGHQSGRFLSSDEQAPAVLNSCAVVAEGKGITIRQEPMGREEVAGNSERSRQQGAASTRAPVYSRL
ncbi:unnamed protein product [Amoebophrya sp. A120]|nr:unnamed protein product [Amoebophrya sp. A120]|eukprot:GSA120T00019202001.1